MAPTTCAQACKGSATIRDICTRCMCMHVRHQGASVTAAGAPGRRPAAGAAYNLGVFGGGFSYPRFVAGWGTLTFESSKPYNSTPGTSISLAVAVSARSCLPAAVVALRLGRAQQARRLQARLAAAPAHVRLHVDVEVRVCGRAALCTRQAWVRVRVRFCDTGLTRQSTK